MSQEGEELTGTAPTAPPKRLNVFEQYLSVWVLICMIVGVGIANSFLLVATWSKLEFVRGSQVNGPIAILIWLMIYPMMLKIDFSSLVGVTQRPKGLLVTLFVNLFVNPLSFGAWPAASSLRADLIAVRTV